MIDNKTVEPLAEPLTPRERDVLRLLAQHLRYQDIATELTMTVNSVKWYVQQIYGKLSVDNRREAIRRAHDLLLLDNESMHLPGIATPQAAHNLPRLLTRFLGREKEVAVVAELLRQSVLVTLTGSGGVGKTRLALTVAGTLVQHFDHGVWLADLASLSDPEQLPQALAAVFELRKAAEISPMRLLVNFLREKQLLLILDNCEHLLDACAHLAEMLLHACPQLTLLATSREIFGIQGETTYLVSSLSLPTSGETSPDKIAQSEAVQLFADRAAKVRPGYRLMNENLLAVANICRQLDGIPLAIELAAAQTRVLNLEDIVARLDDRFELLKGGSRTAQPRHRSLRAVIDWSYQLLEPSEQVLLRRLAVFNGGWTWPAAEDVCGGEKDGAPLEFPLFEILTSLTNKSLVVVDEAQTGETRYHLLESVRAFARERLADAAEEVLLRDCHLRYFSKWAEQASGHFYGPQQKQWMNRIRPEIGNIGLALEWSREHNLLAGLRLALLLNWYYESTGWEREGQRWLEWFVDLPDVQASTALYAEALAYLSYSYAFFDLEWCDQLANESLRIAQGAGAPPHPMALVMKGWKALRSKDFETMRAWLKEAEQHSREQLDWLALFLVKNFLGRQANVEGNQEITRQCWLDMKDVARQSGSPWMVAWADLHLAVIVLDRGDLLVARQLIEESRAVLEDFGQAQIFFPGVGRVRLLQGDYTAAHAIFDEMANYARMQESWQELVSALGHLAYLAFIQNDDEGVQDALRAAERILEEQPQANDDCKVVDWVKAQYLSRTGDLAGAWTCLEHCQGVLDVHQEGELARIQGDLAYRAGQLDLAAALFSASIRTYTRAGIRIYLVEVLEQCGDLLCASNPALAAQVLGCTDTFRKQKGMPRHLRFQEQYMHLRHRLNEGLSESHFEQEAAKGQLAALEEMSALVLSYLAENTLQSYK